VREAAALKRLEKAAKAAENGVAAQCAEGG
jgi:hypothetical protein